MAVEVPRDRLKPMRLTQTDESNDLPAALADPQDRFRLMRWSYAVVMAAGAWLISSAFVTVYGNLDWVSQEVLKITRERGLPSVEMRGAALFWNDIVCGVVLLLSGFAAIERLRIWAPWMAAAVGLWLIHAPLVFWAPTAAVYMNETLIGTLVVATALIIPGLPGFKSPPGTDIPPGWNYNPSTWLQRAPIIAVALFGFFASRYLAAYQLGHIPRVWDPMFGDGTRKVLDSDVSMAFPVSDAGLGAVSYLLEALTGFLGGRARWRTMPWMVIVFGILVVPLGVTSIILVILQPLAVGYWCFLCLLTAVLMLIMVAPAMDEVIATCQCLAHGRRTGRGFWRTFFLGGTMTAEDGVRRELRDTSSPWKEFFEAAGLTYAPWNLLISALLGVWLMAAPNVLGYEGMAAKSDQFTGAMVVTWSIIAFGDVARAFRYLNLPLALWLAISPWVLEGTTQASMTSDLAVAAALLALAWRRGKISDHFGGWDRWVF